MSDKPPSQRRQIIDRLAQFIITNRLANPFGGDVYQDSAQGNSTRYYAVDLAVPARLDATVRVYGPHFILIVMRGRLAIGGDQRVYDSERAAKDFLRLLLVEHKPNEALAVPTKAPKPK